MTVAGLGRLTTLSDIGADYSDEDVAALQPNSCAPYQTRGYKLVGSSGYASRHAARSNGGSRRRKSERHTLVQQASAIA